MIALIKTTIKWVLGTLLYTVAIGLFILTAREGAIQKYWTKDTEDSSEVCKVLSIPCPPDCEHLYDVGKHREWAECMNVGYIQ